MSNQKSYKVYKVYKVPKVIEFIKILIFNFLIKLSNFTSFQTFQKSIYILICVFFIVFSEVYSQEPAIIKIFTVGKSETFQVGTKVLCIRGPGIAHENTYFEYRAGKNDNEYIIELKSFDKIIQRITTLEKNVSSLKNNEKISLNNSIDENTTSQDKLGNENFQKSSNDTINLFPKFNLGKSFNNYIAPNPGLGEIIQSKKTSADFENKIIETNKKNKVIENEYQNNLNRLNYLANLKKTNPDLSLMYQREMDSLKLKNDLLSLEKQKLNVQNVLLSDAKRIAELQTVSLRNLVLLIAISGTFLAIIAIFIFINNMNKRKINKKLNELNSSLVVVNNELTNKNEFINNQNILIQEQNTEIMDSIEYARRIQNAILPIENDIRKIIPGFYVLYLPRDVVSGDFYWFYHTEQYTFIALADCTGHGVPGAFMSMIGNELLNEIVISRKIFEPDIILEELHNALKSTLRQSSIKDIRDGMDIGLLRIENDNSDLSKSGYIINFAGAKISLIYILNNELFELKATRKSIGEKQKEISRKFENNKLSIVEQCQLYLLSDGFSDLHSSTNEKYGLKRAKEFILENSKNDFEIQKVNIENEIINFRTSEKIRDDVTIIGVKLN